MFSVIAGEASNLDPLAQASADRDCSSRYALLARTRRDRSPPRRNAGRLQPDLVDPRSGRDVERLVVGVAELDVGGKLGRLDRADVLAVRRDDPDSSRAGLPQVAVHIDAQ